MLSPFGCQAEVCGGNDNNFEALFSQREELFNWLDKQANNNSGESSSRKVASKETSRREVENWYYMHFRFRMQGYQSLIYAIRQSAREDSVFSEDHLDKWTFKMRFRIRKSSPLKVQLDLLRGFVVDDETSSDTNMMMKEFLAEFCMPPLESP
uniref:Uncharacterized protein n=1 Tax=Macrostomum lignano TaxID=282301 RepID=A0A1I8FRK5_9PLAT